MRALVVTLVVSLAACGIGGQFVWGDDIGRRVDEQALLRVLEFEVVDFAPGNRTVAGDIELEEGETAAAPVARWMVPIDGGEVWVIQVDDPSRDPNGPKFDEAESKSLGGAIDARYSQTGEVFVFKGPKSEQTVSVVLDGLPAEIDEVTHRMGAMGIGQQLLIDFDWADEPIK